MVTAPPAPTVEAMKSLVCSIVEYPANFPSTSDAITEVNASGVSFCSAVCNLSFTES